MPTVSEVSHEIPIDKDSPTPREFDILDVLLILAARKGTIFLATVAGLALGIGLVFLVTPSYTAKASILPPTQDQSSGNVMMGQFGALASMTGLGSSLGIKNPVDLYIGILQSQSVTDAMIRRFHLMEFYNAKKWTDVRTAVRGASNFVANKDGMIDISVTDHDPRKAADMANAYVDELYQIQQPPGDWRSVPAKTFFRATAAAGERQAGRR